MTVRQLRSSLALVAVPALAALLTGCGFQDPPTTPPASAASTAPAAPEAQDPCTQVALTLLDGQLNGVPSADPASLVRANAVVKEFVDRYDQTITAAGVPAARGQYAGQVAAACARPASAGPSAAVPAPPTAGVPVLPPPSS